MTDVQTRPDAAPTGPVRPAPRRGPAGAYLALLRTPGAARFCLAAMVGRAPMAMFGLGTVLLVAASSGSYAVAGLVSAAGSAGYAISAPLVARAADRHGQGRVLRPVAAVFGLTCLLFAGCAVARAPVWALLVTGCLAGSSMPSLGSMVRARWSALLEHSPAELQAAYALESVADEIIFVVGPAVVTVLATAAPPSGVLACLVVGVSGTVLFAAQRGSEPPARPRGLDAGRAGGDRVPVPGLLTLALAYLCLGAMFTSVDLSTVSFAQAQGLRPFAGLVLGGYALGSAAGGLWYGARRWRGPLARRFVLGLALTVTGVATFCAQPNLLGLGAEVLVAGLTIAPTLITGYGIIERQATQGRRTEAMTWLTSTISVGVAAGSAACGRILDAAGPHWGFAFAACCGVAAVTICLLGIKRLAATGVTPTAEWVGA